MTPVEPVTVCALLYGDFPHLADRLLAGLYSHTDPATFQLRIGLNAVSPATRAIVDTAVSRHGNITITVSEENIFKCPMMQRLFHGKPITTPWTIWFDDDSHVTSDSWLPGLHRKIAAHPGTVLLGQPFLIDLPESKADIIRAGSWYTGKPLPPSPDPGSATRITFPTGGFWALRTSWIDSLPWPDPRLIHFDDDYLLAEAVRQQGGRFTPYHEDIIVNDASRRAPPDTPNGYSEK